MFYHFISKIFSPLLDPGNLLLFGLVLGIALMWTRFALAGKRLVMVAVAGFLIVALLPLGNWLMVPLENRFAANLNANSKIDGIIVLGGATQSFLSIVRQQPSLNANAERLTAFVTLAREHPSARLVFTGGSSALRGSIVSEADIAEQVFKDVGFDTSRIYFERGARNTWENANKTLPVIKPEPGQVWLLVTSARHMPRAMGVFRKVGWPVQAWPVDYRTGGQISFSLRFNLRAGLVSLSESVREWTALLVYNLLDRTAEIFPAP
jgi:uncharacterized SAM-binding protein YcdF (DUF218 family)